MLLLKGRGRLSGSRYWIFISTHLLHPHLQQKNTAVAEQEDCGSELDNRGSSSAGHPILGAQISNIPTRLELERGEGCTTWSSIYGNPLPFDGEDSKNGVTPLPQPSW